MVQDTNDGEELKSGLTPSQVEAQRDGTEDPSALSSDLEDMALEVERTTPTKKPLAFHIAFWGINVVSLVFSLDATTLAVAIPVSLRYQRFIIIRYTYTILNRSQSQSNSTVRHCSPSGQASPTSYASSSPSLCTLPSPTSSAENHLCTLALPSLPPGPSSSR